MVGHGPARIRLDGRLQGCQLLRVEDHPGGVVVGPRRRGVHADQAHVGLTRAAASAINASINCWKAPCPTQMRKRS